MIGETFQLDCQLQTKNQLSIMQIKVYLGNLKVVVDILYLG